MTTSPDSGGRAAAQPQPTVGTVAYVLGSATGGTALHVAMLAAGCTRAGIRVTVAGPSALAETFAAQACGCAAGWQGVMFERVDIGDRPRPASDFAVARHLRALLSERGPDVVHAHGVRAGALSAIALWRSGRAALLVVTVHNAPPPGRVGRVIYRVLERIAARRADVVLCVSPDLSQRMRRLRADAVRRAVVATAPAPAISASARQSVRAELGVSGRPLVLAVGRLSWQKGFDTLVTAATSWRGMEPAPILVIAGAGPLASNLSVLAQDLSVDARFLGQRDDVAALLGTADVFVLPSRWEGQPMILQEALRAGRPVVATDVGGVRAMTGDDAALLVPPENPAALAEAVLRILTDRTLANRLTAAAHARAAALPSQEDALAAALEVYGATRRNEPGKHNSRRRRS